VYLVYAHRLFGFTPDDTFIFLRYARNWATGAGPVFNPGEAVQGYTSTLWLAWLAIVTPLSHDPVLAVKLSSAVLGLSLLFACYAVARELLPDRRFPLAPLLLVGFLDLPFWAVSGMDTLLFAALANVALYWYLVSWRVPRAALAVGACLALAGLARPEGILVAAAVGAFEWHRTAHRPSRLFLWSLAAALAVIACQYAWALAEYGSLLPNSYYAKRIAVPGALAGGIRYLRDFLKFSSGAFVLLLAGLAFLDDRARSAVRMLAGVAALLVAYVVWVGGDPWGTVGSQRFFVVLLPMLAVLMDVGAGALAGLVRPHCTTRRVRVLAVASAAVVLGTFLNPTGIGSRPAKDVGGDREMAEYMASLARPGDALVVTDIGQFGYYSGLRIIDTYGLVTPFVARTLTKIDFNRYTPESTARLVAYVFAAHPRFIILKGGMVDGQPQIADECAAPAIFADPRFALHYRFLRASRREPYLLYLREGTE